MAKAGVAADRDAAPRLRRPTALAAVLGRAAAPAFGQRGFGATQVITQWAAIVGPDLAALACPLMVRFPRQRNDGATLTVRVAHGPAATTVQMKSPVILDRVNRFFGYAAVARLAVEQGPVPAPARPAAVRAEPHEAATVGSPSVETALRRLGDAVGRRSGQ
ncbi:MAG: DUF721 domain-containing protein [Rhodospirillaceae bacterium]|nr:DUF721 domain-containing protein [Rhodospirillaceae bacterium]